jgi:hypothetical protein
MPFPPAILWHWTDARNLPSIRRFGLHPLMAQTAIPSVWACEEWRVGWARQHIGQRHLIPRRRMVLLRIKLRRADWRRSGHRAVWVTHRRIPPAQISVVR